MDKIYLENVLEEMNEIDNPQDRLKYLIDLSMLLPKSEIDIYNSTNKVKGCASNTFISLNSNDNRYQLLGDSESQFAKAFIYILSESIDNQSKEELTKSLNKIDNLLKTHLHLFNLTPSRSNSFYSIISHVKEQITNN